MKTTISILFTALLIIPISFHFMEVSFTEIQTSTLLAVIGVYVATAILCFAVSELARNYSQVDKLWSIIPVVFAWTIAGLNNFEPRLLLMALLATVWGIRLTYNFARRGGYSWKFWEGDEDYRWEVLRKNPLLSTRIKWTLFNLGFISFYQLGLLLMITLPMIPAIGSSEPLGPLDFGIAVLFLGLVAFETIADQQQWNFQNRKHALKNSGQELPEKYGKGFIAEGLWSISRHPNYFAEQSIWVVFYLFSVVATGSLLNWSIIGSMLLILLFQGSANFSEGITLSKYPKYQNYQARTPKFFPRVNLQRRNTPDRQVAQVG